MKEASNTITTPRLLLRLIDNTVAEAILAGDLQTAGQMMGVAINEDLLDYHSSFKYGQKQLEDDPLYSPWSARAIILPDEKIMIGLIRFHNRPDPEYIYDYGKNAAEFGYSIFLNYRQRGYATEAVKAMMDWAAQEFGICRFLASVSPDNTASLRLITKLGFTKVDEIMDDVDGMEHVFLHVIPKS